jgi:serine/threonine protein kinase
MPTCIGCSQEIPATVSYCPRCGTPNPEAATIPTPTEGRAVPELTPAEEMHRRLQAALGADFRVDRVQGEGGFAVVFAVQELRLSRWIAVKVLRPELTSPRRGRKSS